MNNLVEIVNLTKKYGTNVAVNHLTVSLPKGKIQTVDKAPSCEGAFLVS